MTTSAASANLLFDTAYWAAALRASESEHPGGLLRDPFARLLSGQRGVDLVGSASGDLRRWAVVMRTCLFDELIETGVREGADTVLNLGAGFDARPYRLELPEALRWIEVDLPEVLARKQAALREQVPRCQLERCPGDLSDGNARRALIAQVTRGARRVLVVTEGVMVYFDEAQAAELADDLLAAQGIWRWVQEMVSPQLLDVLRGTMGARLHGVAAALRFAPLNGPEFFTSRGWRIRELRSLTEHPGCVARFPFVPRLFGRGDPGGHWSGICVLQK